MHLQFILCSYQRIEQFGETGLKIPVEQRINDLTTGQPRVFELSLRFKKLCMRTEEILEGAVLARKATCAKCEKDF